MQPFSLVKTCRQCSANFTVTAEDLDFYEKVSPVFNEKKELISPPTLCSDCRQRRRLAFRNERNLYKRKCDVTGRDMVSIYHPYVSVPVYAVPEWEKRTWNPEAYAAAYIPDNSLFQQLLELRDSIPRPHIHALGNENCEYVNQSGYSKDCYLAYITDYSQDCLYTHGLMRCADCVDTDYATDSSRCYASLHMERCHAMQFSAFCEDCSDSFFLIGCHGCQHCFCCTNLSHAKYCWENIQLTPEAYTTRLSQIVTQLSYSTVQKYTSRVHHALQACPCPAMHGAGNESCTGDFVYESKHSHHCYSCERIENCRYCTNLRDVQDSYDWDYVGYNGQLSYECLGTGDTIYHALFCTHIWGNAHNITYCDLCMNVQDCFACIGLKDKQYCILNKQYSKEEYEALVPKIIAHMRHTGEWGEFFSPSLSPFGYNETVAQEYFPLSKEEALKLGFNWSDYEAPFPKVEKTIPADKLPEDITKIPDDILGWAIVCETTGKPFRIIKQELEFYRKHNLSIPKRHPDQRHLDRMALRNPRKLWERMCDKCGTAIQTSYAPERPEQVYCETCYNKEVYG